MPWPIYVLPPAEAFLAGLETDEYEMFDAALTLLEEHGPNLGEPLVKLVVTSDHKNMKELRRQSKGRIYRVLFALDSQRRAAILTGGDKAEIGFDDFYTEYVPIADALFTAHQADCAAEAAAKKTAVKKPVKKKRGR
jgi:hypothetical protein